MTDALFLLRKQILECNHCFGGGECPKRCWHHEDILGGYEPGRILVLTINPQRPFDPEWDDARHRPRPRSGRGAAGRSQRRSIRRGPGLETYRRIRDATDEQKMAFADASLGIFAGDPPGAFADWVARHPGHRKWLPMVCRLLLGASTPATRRVLADHFVFLDIYKHATADQLHLDLVAASSPIRDCPGRWLDRQVELLRPALVLLCGQKVIAEANERWDVGGQELRELKSVKSAHGRAWTMRIHEADVEVRTAYGLASRSAPLWDTNEMGTTDVRDAIKRVVRSRAYAGATDA